MKTLIAYLFCLVLNVESVRYQNVTYQPVERQLLDFKHEHPFPVGVWTKNSGTPTDIRETVTINSDQFSNQLLLDTMFVFDGERIPERVVHAKGTGAFGYFEVTHDVSKYTYADVFNGIGKRTPVVVRFSTGSQGAGGSDLARQVRGMAIKFYTRQGNLDLLGLQTPVYRYRDPILFSSIQRAFRRNPQTLLFDFTAQWDIVTLRPEISHIFFWLMADYGIPNGYRKMDSFPIHTFEISNKNGETHYVKFNFRTEQGFSAITTPQAAVIQGTDPNYFNRDLYNAIDEGNFPAWKLEMDVMTPHDIQNVDFDPFDVTRLWKNGTFHTVQIGRLVLDKNVVNQFRDVEQGAFNPGHLVPGIPGPPDFLFRGRRMFYRDTQNYRLGRNHNKIYVNMPLYAETYDRDGRSPVRMNMENAPNHYPNSFNGPMPYVDEQRPKKKLQVLESNAVDLEPTSYFYNHILEDEAHRQRLIDNLVRSLVPVTPPVVQRGLKLMDLIDRDLGRRVRVGYEVAVAKAQAERAYQATSPPNHPIRNIPSAVGPPDYPPQKGAHSIRIL